MIDLYPIPAFSDNYIWALYDTHGHCVVVDPGEAAPVEHFLARESLELKAILITHHHPDHTGGVPALLGERDVPVYAPREARLEGQIHQVGEGDRFSIAEPALSFEVMHIPGHTLGHIAFVCDDQKPPLLFCGDTLFAAGCGKLFEGTPEQMLDSLDRLAALPGGTRVCCGHEYTLKNLQFARAVTPEDEAVQERLEQVAGWREQDRVTLPSTIEQEQRTNPFLRVDDSAVKQALRAHGGLAEAQDRASYFAALRDWKDRF